jgi:RHS repeat-associated protein
MYEPYGTVSMTSGTGSSSYGYTNEYQDSYNDLVYLRARQYSPSMGRFLTRDTWTGSDRLPMSYNAWLYGYANPVNLADPSGFNPNCIHPYMSFCAFQRVDEILTENKSNGVKALASLFSDSELQNVWGNFVGRTSATRLEWLLNFTLGSSKSKAFDGLAKGSCALLPEFLQFHFQMAVLFPGGNNSGLPVELEDSQFYDGNTWIKQESNQIGHFLSAVSEYYYKRDLQLIISHEESVDPCGELSMKCAGYLLTNITNEVTSADRSHFNQAWFYDTNGMYAKRDQELWAILKFDPNIVTNLGDVDPARQGNSLQDLRLSLRGVRFADWVMLNRSSNPNEAGQWLMTNLLLP